MPEMGHDPHGEAGRRAGLVSIRRRATLLLVAVAAVFAATFALGDGPWVGFVRATAEAAMVGGIADWFAVVALFRHPLGLPIPHTAVIPHSKEGLGANLAMFVSDNFLDPNELATRLNDADIAARLGAWLTADANAEATAHRLSGLLATVLDDADADQMGQALLDATVAGAQRLPTVRMAGHGLEAAISGGHHDQVLTAAVLGIRTAILDNEAMLRRRLYEESPRWVPPALDDIVFDRAAAGLTRFLGEVAGDPTHPVRSIIDDRLQDLATTLQSDPASTAAVHQRLEQLAATPVLADWAAQTWREVTASVRTAADDPQSGLRRRLAQRLRTLGDQLQHDDSVRAGVDDWVAAVAPTIARESRTEIAGLVAATVDRWDPEETSARLELWLGRDLQFVRINGTVVGGLVGLVLHSITVVLGG